MKNLDRHLFSKEPAIFIPFQRHGTQLWQDILLYRGELARCADLLAFQLGKDRPGAFALTDSNVTGTLSGRTLSLLLKEC